MHYWLKPRDREVLIPVAYLSSDFCAFFSFFLTATALRMHQLR